MVVLSADVYPDRTFQVTPIDVKDCQYWVRRYVAALVAVELLDPSAVEALVTAPLH